MPLKKKKKQSEVKNLEDIFSGRAVYVNGPVVNKIIREPFVVTLSSKKKKLLHPSKFNKNVKN